MESLILVKDCCCLAMGVASEGEGLWNGMRATKYNRSGRRGATCRAPAGAGRDATADRARVCLDACPLP